MSHPVLIGKYASASYTKSKQHTLAYYKIKLNEFLKLPRAILGTAA